MAVRRKARLDALNVAYGVGAAIVITGAMFKFLNYEGANIMLFVGLTTEAIVFFISAFELKRNSVDYQWDKVFPQLTKDGPSKVEEIEDALDKANLDPEIIKRLTVSIEKLEQNVHKMNEVSDTAQLTEHISRMKQSSENFEHEINKLNQSIAEMNNYYMKMLEVMGNKSNNQ